MDFFEHQDLARKKTARLVLLFALAVVLIIAAIYAVSVVAIGFAMPHIEAATASGAAEMGGPSFRVFDPIAALIALAVGVLLIGGGTGYKLLQLRSGGMAIAEELGGRLLTHQNADTDGKRLLNIVEEMAIASGTPVPPVYLLDKEDGINAFAAGYGPEDAVIGVTSGAVHGLTRDQLQGVVAHEFSHILSGDMRLNLRLVAVLHGILIVGLTGAAIMRAMFYSGATYRSRSSRENNQGGAMIAIFAIAAALAALGYIGTFFGNLIKSAVSRQREYLADASAVQFTRNPEGIAGALKVLGGAKRKGRLRSPNAPEASHMFFGDALSRAVGAFSTHPPLGDRIRRIEPGWDGEFRAPREIPSAGAHSQSAGRPHGRGGRAAQGDAAGVLGFDEQAAVAALLAGQRAGSAQRGTDLRGVTPRQTVRRVGTLDAQGVAQAQLLLARLPQHLKDAAHDPCDARAVILSMLVAPGSKSPARARQIEALRGSDAGVGRAVARLGPSVVALEPALRLPLLEQAMQPLASLTPRQVDAFRSLLDTFINADGEVTLFEWIVRRLVERRLDAAEGKPDRGRVRYYALGQLGDECSVLISAVARASVESAQNGPGSGPDPVVFGAFGAGAAMLPGVKMRYIAGDDAGFAMLSGALDTLGTVSPKCKKQLLEACAAAVTQDDAVTPREAELFRAVGESLGIPVPVMLATG